VIFNELGDSSLSFLLRIWRDKELGNPQALKSDLYFSIFEAFREHGIEMPFPQRDLHLRTVDASVISTVSQSSLFSDPTLLRQGNLKVGFVIALCNSSKEIAGLCRRA